MEAMPCIMCSLHDGSAAPYFTCNFFARGHTAFLLQPADDVRWQAENALLDDGASLELEKLKLEMPKEDTMCCQVRIQ